MRGTISTIDARKLYDKVVVRITLSEFVMQLHFHPDDTLEIDNYWELQDKEGRVIDQFMALKNREHYRIHKLLGCKLVKVENFPNLNQYVLTFDDSRKLILRYTPGIAPNQAAMDQAIINQMQAGGG